LQRNTGGRAPISKSAKSALTFPVARVKRQMYKYLAHGQNSIQVTAAVYLTAVLQYLVGDLVEQAALVADMQNKRRITPRCIFLAIREDSSQLGILLSNVTIDEGGVCAYQHLMLKGSSSMHFIFLAPDLH
ncbi:Histone H2A-III, partial [Leucoagaricus sp. SymC.cos]